MSNTREQLIDTMKQLLWERGYDATSPNQVLERSGAGKGSFYHHFKSKKDLAIAAMESRADELIAEFELIFSTNDHWLSKIERYLLIDRDGLKGCRIGRIAQDPSLEDAFLRVPIKRYFDHIHQRMQQLLQEAQQQGEIPSQIDTLLLTKTITSALQGGFVISRSINDGDSVNQACLGIIQLLRQITSDTSSH